MENGDSRLTKYSKEIVISLAVIIRTSQIHDASNVAVVKAVERFVTMINRLLKYESPILLELVGEYFFVNDKRIKFSMEYMSNFEFLTNEFKNHDLGSITFNSAISAGDIQLFLREFIKAVAANEPFEALNEGMKAVQCITLGMPRKIQDEEEVVDARRAVKKTYFGAVSFTRGVVGKVKAGERVNVKKAKRVVQSLADIVLKEEELLLGMTAIKDYDDYTYHHSVNVSILSIAVGQKLGFPKRMLLELGLSALFHDIGKLEIPPEILNKPTEFTTDEWRIVRKHPFWGVKSILSIKGFDQSAINSAIVAYEHHIHRDETGYPYAGDLAKLDLYSRIVGIVDQYDGMTSARVYARSPMSPDRAFKLMLQRGGTQLDPIVLKFFINMVGVYPVGTLVLLNTRELGIVYGSTNDPKKPKVLVIMNPKGERIKGYLVDLTSTDAEGRHRRRVLKTMDPNRYKVNLAEYLL